MVRKSVVFRKKNTIFSPPSEDPSSLELKTPLKPPPAPPTLCSMAPLSRDGSTGGGGGGGGGEHPSNWGPDPS